VGFVEDEGFTDSWKRLGHDDDDLIALQNQISAWPKSAPVIPGTGGVRKLRFVRAANGRANGVDHGFVTFTLNITGL
jgi:hypothetical protein